MLAPTARRYRSQGRRSARKTYPGPGRRCGQVRTIRARGQEARSRRRLSGMQESSFISFEITQTLLVPSPKIDKLQSVEFPEEDKAFVDTIEALADLADATHKWTSKTWFGKNLGWSRDACMTTAHK